MGRKNYWLVSVGIVLVSLFLPENAYAMHIAEGFLPAKWEEKLKAITQKSVVHGATGVPTFIINDEYRIVGAQPYEKFEEILKKIKRSD